ncbi:MAG: transposase [Bacilli bacterium]|nr:transposase [Bacilli bacterium]
MVIYKAYKFRLYPTNEQQVLINKTLGCNRFVYNYYLNKKIQLYKDNKQSLSCFECNKDIPNLVKDYPFLKEIDSLSLRNSMEDLDNAYTKFFKEKKGFPKYKKKNSKNSYRTNMITSSYYGNTYANIKLDLMNKEIILPKLKKVKIRGYRNLKKIEGRIINTTITRESDNTYYVSVLYEQDIILPSFTPSRVIGIDLGIKDLVITSAYEKYINEKYIVKYEKRINLYKRRLSKKVYRSNNYYKAKQKLARLYKKLRNSRIFNIHKITKEITDNNDIIVTENLKINNMVKNHHIAKSLTDASLSEIIRQLEYKSKWKNKQLIKIDTYYPSSQVCSVCEYKNEKVKDLAVREYECPNCGTYHDRDFNASVNIMFEGIKKYFRKVYE